MTSCCALDRHAVKPDPDDDVLAQLPPNVWVWADPYLFLEKKRGDVKDHAILLVI